MRQRGISSGYAVFFLTFVTAQYFAPRLATRVRDNSAKTARLRRRAHHRPMRKVLPSQMNGRTFFVVLLKGSNAKPLFQVRHLIAATATQSCRMLFPNMSLCADANILQPKVRFQTADLAGGVLLTRSSPMPAPACR